MYYHFDGLFVNTKFESMFSGLRNQLRIDEFKEEEIEERLKQVNLETMKRINDLKGFEHIIIWVDY